VRKNSFQKILVCFRAGRVVLLAAVLFLFPATSWANYVTVDCDGGPADYPTLTAALNALHSISYRDHSIRVSGTCKETVNIQDFKNLRLEGTPGATLLDPGTGPFLLLIQQSDDIEVRDLVLRGSDRPDLELARVASSRARFTRCLFEKGGMGLFILSQSNVRLFSVTIQDNLGNGVRVSAGSTVDLDENVVLVPTPSVVQRNFPGIRADGNALVSIMGSAIVRDNRGNGVVVDGAQVFLCCQVGQRQILNNGNYGFQVQRGVLRMNGPTLIEGNKGGGVLLNFKSTAWLPFDQIIRNNGTPGEDFGVGIVVAGGSSLDMANAQVTGNYGVGIQLLRNSSARLNYNTINDNTLQGIQILYMSTAAVFNPAAMTGNGGSNITCDQTSLLYGLQLDTVSNISCKNIVRDLGPPRPGQIH
jgi:hypothetical protein